MSDTAGLPVPSSQSGAPAPPQSYGISEEGQLRHHSQELGLLGKLFGSREHAPINIAGMLMVIGVLGLLLVPFVPEGHTFSQADLAKTLGGIVLAALTFLGGYLGGSKKD